MAKFNFEKALNEMADINENANDSEAELIYILDDDKYLYTYPSDMFEASLDELNEHFGCHDDMMITENVRKYMDDSVKVRDYLISLNEMMGGDEEDEE